MPIDFRMEKKGNYLLVTCQGHFEGKEAMGIHQQALDYAIAEGLPAILVDATGLHGRSPTTMDRFGFGEGIAELQRRSRAAVWLALVGKEPIVNPGRFAETVAVNRGGFMKVFEDTDEVAAWIRRCVTARDGAENDRRS